MIIPVLPAAAVGNSIMTGTLSLNGDNFISPFDVDFKGTASEISAALERRSPILTVDVKGFNGKIVNNDLISKTKTRRSEHWVLTGITTIDDVFDAFYMGADTLLVPYHTVTADLLKEINEISDRCIPMIMTSGHSSLCPSGHEPLMSSLRTIEQCGFFDTVVMETLNENIWDDILKENERIIPMVFGNSEMITEKGFSDVLEVPLQVRRD